MYSILHQPHRPDCVIGSVAKLCQHHHNISPLFRFVVEWTDPDTAFPVLETGLFPFIRPPHSILIGSDCVILSVVDSYPSQLSGVKSVSGSSGEKNYIIIISIPFVKTLHQAHSRDLNPHPDQYLASNKISCQRVGRIERPSLPITDAIFCSSFRAANRQTGFEKPIQICDAHRSKVIITRYFFCN